jgi:hypothetical protein
VRGLPAPETVGSGTGLHAAGAPAHDAAAGSAVIEGDAARVTEFNAPSQGPPPWNVYRIEPRSAIVTLAAEPGGLTRFRF